MVSGERKLGTIGRISRTDFWIGLCAFLLLTAVNMILLNILYLNHLPWVYERESYPVGVWPLIYMTVQLFLLISLFILFTGRLRDRNKSSLWVYFYLGLPLGLLFIAGQRDVVNIRTAVVLSFVVLLIETVAILDLGVFPGTKGENRFGPRKYQHNVLIRAYRRLWPS